MRKNETHVKTLSRRAMLLKTASGLGAASLLALSDSSYAVPLWQSASGAKLKGRLKQSACRWCYRNIPLEDLAKFASEIGLKGIDLLNDPNDWPIVKKYGLIPTMTSGAGTIPDACNRKDLHDKLEKEFQANIPRAAENGIPNVITFSGNRKGMSDGEGLENTVAILNRVKGIAEKHNVTICMELLNSKVNHKDYMFDHTAWGVDVIKRVNSPRVKILYDIYHAQIMDGDIVRNIRDHFQWIGHFHTGGNPGRHEIDETNELNYRFVMQAIAELGFTGFVSHEYSPSQGNDPIATLEKAIQICDV